MQCNNIRCFMPTMGRARRVRVKGFRVSILFRWTQEGVPYNIKTVGNVFRHSVISVFGCQCTILATNVINLGLKRILCVFPPPHHTHTHTMNINWGFVNFIAYCHCRYFSVRIQFKPCFSSSDYKFHICVF